MERNDSLIGISLWQPPAASTCWGFSEDSPETQVIASGSKWVSLGSASHGLRCGRLSWTLKLPELVALIRRRGSGGPGDETG